VPRQEQELASEEITEVAPGILRMQLPIQFTGLGHVNCYALEDERGFAIVDPGLPGQKSWEGLVDRLGRAGIPQNRIAILTHSSFKLWWDRNSDGLDDTPSDALDQPEDWARPTPWGGEFRPPVDPAMSEMRTEMRSADHHPHPTIRVEDGELITLGRRQWVSLHTPGHTPDHLCLFDPDSGVVFAGDHVLPSITPHIGGLDGVAEDPLAEFFSSLDRMAKLENVTVALPAHGHPFVDLAGRVREIEEHHVERLASLRKASEELDRPAPVQELMQQLFSPRAWGSMAESETYAHLEHLRLTGSATTEWRNGLLCYQTID